MERPREPDRFGRGSVPLLPDSLRDAASYMLRVRKAAKAYFGPAGQTEAAWNLLLALQGMEDGKRGCHVGAAAKRADVPHTTAVRSLKSLHSHGFVSLSRDPSDRRATLVRMTSTGLEALRRAFSDVIASPHNA